MANLGMGSDIVATPAKSPAALNRYIYFPDHLVRIPGPVPGASLISSFIQNLTSFFTEPALQGVLRSALAEPSLPPRAAHVTDESVGDFVARRFSPAIANNLASALFHGIYAGDIYNLSARTLLPRLWHYETMEAGIMGSMSQNIVNARGAISYDVLAFLDKLSYSGPPPEQLADVAKALSRSVVFTLRRGLHQLVTRLEGSLRSASNVTVHTGSRVKGIDFDPSSKTVSFDLTNGSSKGRADYVISTTNSLPSSMSDIKMDPKARAVFADWPTGVHVMVVNLFFSNPSLLKSHRGFGYLIPSSVPIEQNPERALGVIFGSETSNPTGIDGSGQDTAPGTKLTVMLGGHWWSDWDPSDLPSPDDAVQMALSILRRHLKITDYPVVAKAKLAWNAIPQYRVGYRDSMASVHELLMREFQGRLKVAGPWTQAGVGVNDCVRKGWEAARAVVEDQDAVTGVEGMGAKERWFVVDREGGVRISEGGM